jgi:hypothetical protein
MIIIISSLSESILDSDITPSILSLLMSWVLVKKYILFYIILYEKNCDGKELLWTVRSENIIID